MTELVQRLRRTVYRNGHYKDDTRVPVNPDGPEAADRIEALEVDREQVERDTISRVVEWLDWQDQWGPRQPSELGAALNSGEWKGTDHG